MKRLALLSLAAILAVSCQAQSDSSQDFALAQTQRDSVKPKGQWSVHKEVDEQGNIIRYDSIYSWSSSGNDARTLQNIDPDSLMSQMRERMRSSFGMMQEDPFAGFFGSDSIERDPFINDFFKDDPFDGFPTMDAIRKRMEAMMQQHLGEEYPSYRQPWIPAEPEEEKQPDEKTEKTKWKQAI